jgi:hypothetical protein
MAIRAQNATSVFFMDDHLLFIVCQWIERTGKHREPQHRFARERSFLHEDAKAQTGILFRLNDACTLWILPGPAIIAA